MEEEALGALPYTDDIAAVYPVDVVFRIAYPMNVSSTKWNARNTWVFGATETKVAFQDMLSSPRATWRSTRVQIVTPSKWSGDGFVNSGVPPGQVHVLPHGVDTSVYRPATATERAHLRTKRGWTGRFVFLVVASSRLADKGVPEAISAFGHVRRMHPTAVLAIKCYNSSRVEALLEAAGHMELLLLGGVQIIRGGLASAEVAALYQAADAFLSPYKAEGFNMPCLEALACGRVVIATLGGPTDDFLVQSDAAIAKMAAGAGVGADAGPTAISLGVSSRPGRVQHRGGRGWVVVPSPEHLRQQMVRAMHDKELAARAQVQGPAYVQRHFTWAHIVQQLLALFETHLHGNAGANSCTASNNYCGGPAAGVSADDSSAFE